MLNDFTSPRRISLSSEHTVLFGLREPTLSSAPPTRPYSTAFLIAVGLLTVSLDATFRSSRCPVWIQ